MGGFADIDTGGLNGLRRSATSRRRAHRRFEGVPFDTETLSQNVKENRNERKSGRSNIDDHNRLRHRANLPMTTELSTFNQPFLNLIPLNDASMPIISS